MTDAPLLELAGLAVSYAVGDGLPPLVVLRGVDLSVAAGEAVAIVGPSGSGKSTLLHAACGLVGPTAGAVRFAGRDLARLDAGAVAEIRNREIGLVFQDHHLLPQCTVLENALVPTLAGWEGPGDAEGRARSLCERVGLGARLAHRPAQLSGGERQRVAVVRALVNEPRLLLADEPTGSLDGRTSEELATLLDDLRAELGVALVVVTHSVPLAQRMDRTLELTDGRLGPLAAAR